jgi:transcriptional regulator with XRE-family HTH domain
MIMADYVVDYAAVGEKIRTKRLSTGLSQDAVSERVGLSEGFYGHIERGSKTLSVESLVKIANYFGLSLDYLLSDSLDTIDSDSKLQAEFDNIFKDKTQPQKEYLIKILKMFSMNIEDFQK